MGKNEKGKDGENKQDWHREKNTEREQINKNMIGEEKTTEQIRRIKHD